MKEDVYLELTVSEIESVTIMAGNIVADTHGGGVAAESSYRETQA